MSCEERTLKERVREVEKLYFAGRYDEVLPLLQVLADEGCAEAQIYLGNCYGMGRGVSLDKAKAFEWWQKAADQNNASAQCLLGSCYEHGEGVAQDYELSASWFRKAAENGDVYAQRRMGYFYGKGDGVPKDDELAASWFRKAAAQGDEVSCEILNICPKCGAVMGDKKLIGKFHLESMCSKCDYVKSQYLGMTQ